MITCNDTVCRRIVCSLSGQWQWIYCLSWEQSGEPWPSQQWMNKPCTVKVGTSGYGNIQTMNTDKWATSKSTRLSTKIWVKLFLLLENALKLNFEALQLTENLNPLQGPPAQSNPIINKQTEQVKNYGWIYHGMHWTLCLRSKPLHWKARIWLSKKFQTQPPNPLKSSPVSERSAYPCKTTHG